MICKTYKDIETKTQKRAKKAKTKESTSTHNFINVEDEVLLKVCVRTQYYCALNQDLVIENHSMQQEDLLGN